MLSFRQVTSLIWSLSAFVLAAALALHLRYRPLAEQPAYLDTWTGDVRGAVAGLEVSTAGVEARVSDAERRVALEGALRRLRPVPPRDAIAMAPCTSVRFAFPAPGGR